MFLVNSRYPYFSATSERFYSKISPSEAYLLPKLRYYFAEFLNWSYLKRLGIFYLPTCVGLRYDYTCFNTNEDFLGDMDPAQS